MNRMNNPYGKRRRSQRPQQRPAITMVEYIAMTRPHQARRMIVAKFGLTPARNQKELIAKMHYIIQHHKEEALKELASIHPDKDLILDMTGAEGAIGKAGGNDEYSYNNFITNYRSDVHDFQNAEGEAQEHQSVDNKKEGGKVDQGLVLAGIISLAIIGLVLTKK